MPSPLRFPTISVLVSGCLLAGACINESPVQPARTSDIADVRQFVTLSGARVSETVLRSRLAAITRQLALALSDPNLRAGLYQALQSSPFREHKLHVRDYLSGDGQALANAVAHNALGLSVSAESQSRQIVGGLIDLELYIPVERHRLEWKGGSNLIVATAIYDEDIPVAFDLNGDPVVLRSATKPPETPSLVLVPTETKFDRVPVARVTRTAVADFPPTAAVATRIWLRSPDSYEGWSMGQPEFEIHVFQKQADGRWTDEWCNGAGWGSGPLWFDMNGQEWNQPFQVGSGDLLAHPNEFHFQMWEDDFDFCGNIDETGYDYGRPPHASESTARALEEVEKATYRVTDSTIDDLREVYLYFVLYTPLGFILGGSITDDFVGRIDLAPRLRCFRPDQMTGPVRFDINGLNSNYDRDGWIEIDFRSGHRKPICDFSAELDGPRLIELAADPPTQPVYTGRYWGRVGPASFEWKDNGPVVGQSDTYTMSPLTVGWHLIELRVTMGSEVATTELWVEVREGCTTGCGQLDQAPVRDP